VIQTLGVYLIFFAVALRGAVEFSADAEFSIVVGLLVAYGLLLFVEMGMTGRGFPGLRKSEGRRSPLGAGSRRMLGAYILLQSALVIGLLVTTQAEDFFALLFIPLSLDAVTFFGRRLGFLCIAVFSLVLTGLMLTAEEGRLFGLAMGMFFSGLCFLFGGYADQVQRAEAAYDQNQAMIDELELAHRQLQGFADQMASLSMERERNRLARDLHDSVTQTVFSMNLAAQSARLLLDGEPLRAAEQLLRLEKLGANAQGEIQALVSQLRPRPLGDAGLPAALGQLAAEHKERDGLQVSLDLQGETELSETERAGLYAITHEALINISKHSGACEAVIRLSLDAAGSSLVIEDHGVGFDPASGLNERGHLGLAAMSDRARQIGWSLSIESQPRQGTRIRVRSKPRGARQ
jgi:signal transduction histidine kinase